MINDHVVLLAMISLAATTVTGFFAAAATYFGTKNRDTLKGMEVKVDGRLSETIDLLKAVAFSEGENKQRDKQEIKDASHL